MFLIFKYYVVQTGIELMILLPQHPIAKHKGMSCHSWLPFCPFNVHTFPSYVILKKIHLENFIDTHNEYDHTDLSFSSYRSFPFQLHTFFSKVYFSTILSRAPQDSVKPGEHIFNLCQNFGWFDLV